MKKILILALLTAISCAMLMLFGACAKHEHAFGDWTYVEGQAPDCTHAGYEKRVCSCGEEETRAADALGHDWTWKHTGDYKHERVCLRAGCGETERGDCDIQIKEVAASCSGGGYTLHYCTVCDYSVTDGETPALNHIWSNYSHLEKDGRHVHFRTCLLCGNTDGEQDCALTPHTTDPTCETDGYTEYSCAVCGNYFKANETNRLGHVWSGWAHYEERGTHYRKCTRPECTATESDTCDYESTVTHPTCDEAGYTTHTCKECYDSYKDSETAPTGHEWGPYEHTAGGNTHFRTCLNNPTHKSTTEDCAFKSETVDATCDADGKIIYKCYYCDNSYEEQGESATGHVYGGGWTYAGKDGSGNDCHKKTCLVCGKDETAVCNMVSSSEVELCAPPATTFNICRDCLHGENGEDASAFHRYGSWQQGTRKGGAHYHYRVCENNGDHREEADCNFTVKTVDPECSKPGTKTYTCPVCEFNYSEELEQTGHVYGDCTQGPDRTHTHICVICGESASEPCTLVEQSTTPPTCDARGYTTYFCNKCHNTYEEDFKEPLEHAWGNVVYDSVRDGKHCHIYTCEHNNSHVKYEECTKSNPVVFSPTCLLAGYTEYQCEICHGKFTDDPTPATGIHEWNTPVPVYNPSAIGTDAFYGHSRTCINCGTVQKENCTLDYISKEATCTESGYSYFKCNECLREARKTEIPALQHDFGGYTHIEEDGTDKHTRTCRRDTCGFEEKEPCLMVSSEKAPTCNYTGTKTDMCKKCLYSEQVELEKLTHRWESWKLKTDGTHYHLCSACGAREEAPCVYDVEITEPTCTEEGYTKNTCRECHNVVIVRNGGEGHKWQDIVISGETHSAKCSECGLQVEEAHKYTESNFCSVCKNDGLEYYLDPTQTYYIVWHDRNVRNAKKIEIPEVHLDKPVAEISAKMYNYQTGGFYNNHSVEEVVLPQNLKHIGDGAFAYCVCLRTVTVRNEEDDNYEPSLITIGSSAFRGCSRLVSANNLPETLTTIGENAFRDCGALKEIKLADTLEYIGAHAFYGTAYYKDKQNWNGDALYIGKHLIKADANTTGTYTIESGTLTIGVEAFKDCKELTGIVIPESVIHIDADAFAGCENLETAEFEGDFQKWLNIHFVNDYSSPLCYAKSLRIDQAHDDITIPEGTTVIPANTFRATQIKTIHIPASVTEIDDNAFADCTLLETVTVAKGSNLVYLGKDVFKGSKYFSTTGNWDGDLLYIKDADGSPVAVVAVKETASGEINIQEGTRVIADYAFAGTNIEKAVTPDSIVTIGRYAFENCVSLTEATIGEACREIAEKAFEGCTALTRVNFVNPNGWLYRPMHYAVYRGVGDELKDPASAAQYLKQENLFEIKKLF